MQRIRWLAVLFLFILQCQLSLAQVPVKDLAARLGKTPEGQEQFKVIEDLGLSGSPDAVAPLLDLFDIRNHGMPQSHYIVIALGRLADGRAIPELTEAWRYLRSPQFDSPALPVEFVARMQLVQEGILDAFGNIGGPLSIIPLASASHDRERRLAVRACRALVRLNAENDPRANCKGLVDSFR
jgi:HEAT repeat protein